MLPQNPVFGRELFGDVNDHFEYNGTFIRLTEPTTKKDGRLKFPQHEAFRFKNECVFANYHFIKPLGIPAE